MPDELPNLTVEILKQIRDGVSRLETNLGSRLDETNRRLGETNRRLDGTNERLAGVEMGLKDAKIAVLRVAKVNDAGLDEQMKDTERLEGIEFRMRRLEQHVGLPPLP